MAETPPEEIEHGPEALVIVSELQERLEWTLDADEIRLATGALEDLSDDARFYGSHRWCTPENSPRQVRSLIARAVARHLRNPDGFTVSRAGDETVGWTDKGDEGGVLTFNDREIKMIRQMAGKRGLMSVQIVTGPPRTDADALAELVPTSDGGDPFPYGVEP